MRTERQPKHRELVTIELGVSPDLPELLQDDDAEDGHSCPSVFVADEEDGQECPSSKVSSLKNE